ncbi:MAG: hypothetical protein F4029_01365 [Gammaproteobacteria bacterium]|nr:hypothetical protein [Gammaproteobacteria bacterium]MDE0037139.1 hypothetical protein [Gammaproteobacteria bacterium]MDE0179257.1 hypothetical protein [Gammaproteobacteria bacterium]MDE0444660.1 hypothetical protein [Gammaproteobacteria bacterium]MDE0660153.1 hypothetical protein [Gammaproteobacteria bacterium]
MNKTEVYSWRLRPDLKYALEVAALAHNASMAGLLDQIVTDWLRDNTRTDFDSARQDALRTAALECAGSIRGGDRHRAEQARTRVREVLEGKRRSAQHAR